MKTGKRKTAVTVIAMILVSAIVVFAFYQVQNKSKEIKNNSARTEYESIMGKDLVNSYPSTPRDVLKLYNRILKCYYNSKLTLEELDALAKQAYCLFDDELKEKNPYDEFFLNLQGDIESFAEKGWTVPSTTVDKASSTEYKTMEDRKYASLLGSYLVSEKGQSYPIVQSYTFREDKDANWRILYWELSDETLDGD